MDWTAITVAGIGVIPASVAAYLAHQSKKEAKRSADIVEGNGRGNVVKMLEDVQDCQERLEAGHTAINEKLDDVLAWQKHHLNRWHHVA